MPKPVARPRADPPATTTRAEVIRGADHVRYWVVVDMADLFQLQTLPVSTGLRRQVRDLLRRQPAEGAAEYAARLREADDSSPKN